MFVACEGDSLTYHVGQKFSTYDQEFTVSGCAQTYHGAWWYRRCVLSNLNGLYLRGPHKSFADGVEWHHWKGLYYSLRFTEMKIKAY